MHRESEDDEIMASRESEDDEMHSNDGEDVGERDREDNMDGDRPRPIMV